METAEPRLILVLSGKRKSGKDHVSGLIAERLGAEACRVLRLSGPLKRQYAQEHGLDLAGLLGAGEYKERHRADMIRWGERRRERDPGFFCRAAVAEGGGAAAAPVWVVSDARRPSDLRWFRREYPGVPVRCVRVHASPRTRAGRGWVFVAGIDDAESECGLDDGGAEFDWTIVNDEADARPTLGEQLQPVLSLAEEAAAGHRGDGHPLLMLSTDNLQYVKVNGKMT